MELPGRGWKAPRRRAEGVAGGEWGMRAAGPAPSPAPLVTPLHSPTEWFAWSALFNPRDCSSVGLPVPASAPALRSGAPFGQWRRLPLPSPASGTQAFASKPLPGAGQARWGSLPPRPCPALACCWAPGGANLSQDGE